MKGAVAELPPVIEPDEIGRRLQLIFPPGAPHRNYCTRDLAAKTVFVMLYLGAVEGRGVWLRPSQVARMTDDQASMVEIEERAAWRKHSLKPATGVIPGRWYADNTREPIRDETLRDGLIPVGAVVVRRDLPTTSPKPRYALSLSFADLLRPNLAEDEFVELIDAWRRENLSAAARARVQLLSRAAVDVEGGVLVQFPSGETRRLAEGPSSQVAKAVVEEFSSRFLGRPGVVFLSESRAKVTARDDELAAAIGLRIEADRNLPDVILVDLDGPRPLLVFVEVVASDGAVTETRKRALLDYVTDAGFEEGDVAFVTAYLDRPHRGYKRTMHQVAWGTFVWIMSEPEHIILLRKGQTAAVKNLRALKEDIE